MNLREVGGDWTHVGKINLEGTTNGYRPENEILRDVA